MFVQYFSIDIKDGSWWLSDYPVFYDTFRELKDVIEKIEFVVRNFDELKYNHTGRNSYSGKTRYQILMTLKGRSLVFGGAFREKLAECDPFTRMVLCDKYKETLEKVDGISAMLLLYEKITATIDSAGLRKDFFVGKNEALNLAAEYGELDVCEFLVKRGADVNSKLDGFSVLDTAAMNGHARIVKFLLENQAQMLSDGDGNTPLMCASTADITAMLLDDERGVTTINNFATVDKRKPMSALHCAAFNGNVEQIELLCAHGADIHARDPAGRTALFWASKGNHEDAVRFFIKNRVNVLHGDVRTGETPLTVTDSAKILRLLLDAEATSEDIDHLTLSLRDALHNAVVCLEYEKVKVLIQKGANAQEKDCNGKTALDLANEQLLVLVDYNIQLLFVKKGMVVPDTVPLVEIPEIKELPAIKELHKIIKLLESLDVGTQETPLMVTQSARKTQQLLDAEATGEDFDHPTLSLSYALHDAIICWNYEKVKVLIQNGANAQEKNITGNTALESASRALILLRNHHVHRIFDESGLVPDENTLAQIPDLSNLGKIIELLESTLGG